MLLILNIYEYVYTNMHVKWNVENLTLVIDAWEPINGFHYDYWDDLMFVGYQFDAETTTTCLYKGGESPRYDMVDEIHIKFASNPGKKDLMRILNFIKYYLNGRKRESP